MRRLRPYPVAALAAWTLFVWGNRLWLAWTDDALDVGEKVLSTLPLVVFVGLALVTLMLLVRSSAEHARQLVRVVTGFAAFTAVYWAIRLPMILAGDRSVPFKAVHAVLALGSVALAAAAWKAVRRARTAGEMSPAGRTLHRSDA